MGRSARISWRITAGTFAMLLPFLALTACSSRDQAMADKLAAAEAAANRAIAAQHAAEKAAAAAVSARPAPASEPTVVSDLPSFDDQNDDSGSDGDNELSMGSGEDAVVVPDVGA